MGVVCSILGELRNAYSTEDIKPFTEGKAGGSRGWLLTFR